MKRLIPPLLLLSGCATIHKDGSDEEVGFAWDKGWSIFWLTVLAILIYSIYRIFWLPSGYKLEIGPGPDSGFSSDSRYSGTLSCNGTKLPGKWGNYHGPTVLWIRTQACMAARTHKKWGKL